MDWCVDTGVEGASESIVREVADHLNRHAVEPAVVELTLPVVREALSSMPTGAVWVELDWEDQASRLVMQPIDGQLPGDRVSAGVMRSHLHSAELIRGRDESKRVTVELGVHRVPEPDIDPEALSTEPIDPDQPAAIAGRIATEMNAGKGLPEAAAAAGAAVADFVTRGSRPPADARALAEMIVDTERRIGGEFEVVEAGPHRAYLRTRRCPFGGSINPGMCRFTSAMAGRISAKASGAAEVIVSETMAGGDHQCALVVDLESESTRPASHFYRWPPPSPIALGEEAAKPRERTFQVTLSLQLPRDRLSVPITRHLVQAAMNEVGVLEDDSDAVLLAVTEACANVIDHSGPGDAYDVAVTVNADSCHIRVVDVGRGFDHRALDAPVMADSEAEHGRGVALMHALVDQVRFESEPELGTVVHLVKRLRFSEQALANRLRSRTDS